ncbi:hypothetical protein AGMMS50267_14220 [Spirochaetia bacterium]|nr:hypothetical protein AGMMS50267_14220 [Spirochaetia bacterium]
MQLGNVATLLQMSEPYIQSISISFPACAVQGETESVRLYFKCQNLGKYFKYGNTSIIMNDYITDETLTVWKQIDRYFYMLHQKGVITSYLTSQDLVVHEVQLRFDLPFPGFSFCRTAGFRKINKSTYRSNDYNQHLRDNGESIESKGIQRSFVTVRQCENGDSFIFSFSGRYRQHITPLFLDANIEKVIEKLITLGSIYLTQVTKPEYLRIAPGYIRFLHGNFKKMLDNANWFSRSFKRKYVTNNFIGGLSNDL